MKKILFILLNFLLVNATFAQSAKEILDDTAERFQKSSGTIVAFTATQQAARHATAPIAGTITLKGGKFALDSDALQAWFDGTTLWTALNGSNEVNVSNPTAEEIQAINPLYFITLYKKGYELSNHTSKHNGRIVHEVKLKAKNKKESVQEMSVLIDKSLKQPLQVRLRKGVSWMTIDINSYRANQNVADAVFTFDAKAHPDYDVIDLR